MESAAIDQSGPTQRRLIARIRWALPQGQTLPEKEWRQRHHAMIGLLFAEAIGLTIFAAAEGYSLVHSLEHALPLIPLGVMALAIERQRRLAAVLVSIGLITACALLVHIWKGAIEGHFLFFVTIVVLALYEDWIPFLVAAAYVVVHHGLMGAIDPGGVYNHPDAVAHPWKWAVIHGAFVVAAGVAAVAAWRLNESVRAEAREAYRRAQVAADELEFQALHDSLTSLPNRRSLFADLRERISAATPEQPILLTLFDLNGFKDYNDTFGHPAGDSLLTRIGKRLQTELEGYATAYRMGGDEFCILTTGESGDHESITSAAAKALAEHGEGFAVTASYGSVTVPMEADHAEAAMRIADQRMYARKSLDSRASAGRQSADVLLQILSERSPSLGVHLDRVTSLSEGVARRLPVPDEEVAPLLQAASLHDAGKLAIPDEILLQAGPPRRGRVAVRSPPHRDRRADPLRRPGPDQGRQAGPLLARALRRDRLPRSPQRRGDPSRRSRIISVCDAYDAMVSERPYREPIASEDALAELRRCAGTQFDPEVVAAFEEEIADRDRRGAGAIEEVG